MRKKAIYRTLCMVYNLYISKTKGWAGGGNKNIQSLLGKYAQETNKGWWGKLVSMGVSGMKDVL